VNAPQGVGAELIKADKDLRACKVALGDWQALAMRLHKALEDIAAGGLSEVEMRIEASRALRGGK